MNRPAARAGRTRRPVAALALLAAVLLAGCANLAPRYERPPAPVAAGWPAGAPPAAPDGIAADTGWRGVLADARLQRAVELALANNRDARIASIDVERARALYRVERAAAWPAIDAGAGASRARSAADLTATGRAGVGQTLSVDVGLASYEIDFFGRVRNLREAALQRYLETEQNQRSARISLVAEVALAWLTLAADQERLQLAERTLQAAQSSDDLTRRRHELGAESGLALAQSRTVVDGARVELANWRRQVAQDRHALALLVGTELPAEALPPGGLDDEAARLVAVPEGLPSDVLLRRPDVLAAERELRAAHADIGVARAALFPRISLTAALGTASRSLGGLFEGDNRTWSLGPALSLPIFDAGAGRAAVEVGEADRRIALARYEQTLQTAFAEVADALAARGQIGEQIEAQRSLVEATERSLQLAQARYRTGADSFLEVLDAQRSLYAAQQSLISLQLTEQGNRVSLYRVLGGGWAE